ncbi:MarR family transcriptional regulator [Xanthobacter dioxanivorans]|uniref:MarR family transcriptional regulator n=1 Tax=Xanthobacter dioxanivorans TaxID=2528964 RepID=A0A974PKK9_9HYPH|nr:MarR family transcriptional regulator [Xanthobacter dioxanivorans]QRG05312.1 MarR family transcriptional regulator [Xanthobacter dioxanivorans]
MPINAIVEQWHRERPDLDPEPMRLFGALAQAHLLTTPYMNNVLEQHGLVRGTFDVLSALRRAGLPYSLTPKQLAESLLLSGAGMTNRLDRLESLNLIARLPEPNDRRSLKIQLTQKGVKLIDEIIPKFVEAQHRLVARLGLADTEMLLGLLERLSAALMEDIGAEPSA